MVDWPDLSKEGREIRLGSPGGRLKSDCLERLAALESRLERLGHDAAVSSELAAMRQSITEAGDRAAAFQENLEKLRESEERWRSIAENPFDFVVLIDENACFQYVNHTVPGVKPEDLVGKATIFQWTREEDHGAIRAALDEVFRRGKPAYYEAYAPRVPAWFGTIVGPIFKDGKVVAASILARDITPRHEALLALRDSEKRFRQLAESIDDVFFLIEPSRGKVLYTSPAYESLWGRPRDALLDDMGAWLEGIHPDDRERVRREYQAMIDTFRGREDGYEYRRAAEMRVQRPDGSVRWVRSRLFPIHDDDGTLRRVAGVVTDLTERKLAEVELAKAEERFRVLVESLPVIPYIAAPDEPRRTIYISPQIEGKLGFTQREWTRTPDLWAARIHPQDRERVLAEVLHFLRTGDPLRTRYRLLSRDGNELWFRDEAVLVRDPSGQPKSIQGVMLDVSEAEEALAERQRARALSSMLMFVQEEERRHLARELHDEIGQHLTSLHLQLQAARECPGGHPPTLEGARDLVGELMAKVRELSLDLRPSILDDLGLLPALESMFKRYTGRTGVTVRFEQTGLEGRFDAALETAAYRVVQEALTNVARHAGVQEAFVQARRLDGILELQIHDSGRGFEPATVGPQHGGLAGMRERVVLVGGSMEVRAEPEQGSQLIIRFPAIAGVGVPSPLGRRP